MTGCAALALETNTTREGDITPTVGPPLRHQVEGGNWCVSRDHDDVCIGLVRSGRGLRADVCLISNQRHPVGDDDGEEYVEQVEVYVSGLDGPNEL
jgi:hypothetical protein